jgi:hypothetical protein
LKFFKAIPNSDDQQKLAASLFPCQHAEFPITYLGIPLSMGKLHRAVWQRLIDKVVDKLPVWKGALMHRAGRLTVIKSTLSVVPIYTSICICLPAWVHKAMTKIIKAFLWSGSRKCLVAWDCVQRPTQLGGMGVLDLKRMGMALRL